jgi:CTP synthase
MTEWTAGNELERAKAGDDLAAPCGSAPIPRAEARQPVAEIYGSTEISERHRHRYEVNIAIATGWKPGLRFSGMSPDGVLPEIVERPTIRGSSACSSIPS